MTFCNKFFLKMLAQIGKGYSDVVLYRENLKTQMISLMKKTFGPVLTEVMVGISGVTDCVVYPFPFPDLYIGSPLVLTGAFKGQFPQTVKVRGKLSNGNPYEFKLNSFVAERVPVKKVFYRSFFLLMIIKGSSSIAPSVNAFSVISAGLNAIRCVLFAREKMIKRSSKCFE